MSTGFPSKEQREKLCHLFHLAFVEIRSLAGESDTSQIYALADAFHEIPIEMNPGRCFDLASFCQSLHDYQQRFRSHFDYVVELDKIFGVAPSNDVVTNHEDLITCITRRIESEPDKSCWYLIRSRAHESRGDYGRALADLENAIEIEPQGPIYGSLSWILITSPERSLRNGEKAVTTARFYCDYMGWNDPESLELLAAAYAESEDFHEATQWQEKAIQALPKDLYREALGDQLIKYKQGLKFTPHEFTWRHQVKKSDEA